MRPDHIFRRPLRSPVILSNADSWSAEPACASRNNVYPVFTVYCACVLKTVAPGSAGRVAKFRISDRPRTFRRSFFPDATDTEWNDWRWQLRHSFRGLDALERILDLSEDERSAMQLSRNSLPNAITPYYASLLDRTDASQGLRRT